MKNTLNTIIVLFAIITSNAQNSGIGTTSPNAKLDIVASNPATPANTDGILIPRIDAFPVTAPTITQDAMMVYLTTTDGTDAPGFYFWDNTASSWKRLLDISAPLVGWKTTGNAGSIAGTNFIGTIDDVPLDIRTNNLTSVRFTTNGRMEILNTNNSVYIGENAGMSIDGTDTNNTIIGSQAGRSLAGDYNTFIGANSGYNNLIGNYNTFFGDATGRNNNGFRNVFLGQASGFSNNGSDNIFIGTSAGSTAVGSNLLYIENTNTNTPLIYGEFDNNFVKINGDFEVTGIVPGLNLRKNTTATGWYSLTKSILDVTPSSSGAHNYFALLSELTILGTNDVTDSGQGSAGIFAAAYGKTTGTINTLSGIQAVGYNTGNGIVTELNGVSGYVENSSTGTVTHASAIRARSLYRFSGTMTNAYGVYIENQTFGTNKWGLYSAGTQNNYIGGNLGIGVLAPERALHISDVMRLEPRANVPTSPSEGDLYVNSTDHHIYCYLNGVWKPLD